MTELAFAKTEYTLSENYNRHLLRHIWRALRDERFNFPKGRIPFAAHIYDTIIGTQKKAIYRLEDGTLYSIPDGGIDGKTIENFINKCSTIFELDRVSGHKALNTANFTLRYLHLFLWCKQPERVGKWHSEKRRVIDDLIIKNLDDSFRVFESRKTFPMGIQVLDTSKSEHSLLAMSVESNYNDEDAPSFEADVNMKAPLIGVAIFLPVEGDVLNHCFWFNAAQWDYIKSLEENDFDIMSAKKSAFGQNLIIESGLQFLYRQRISPIFPNLRFRKTNARQSWSFAVS